MTLIFQDSFPGASDIHTIPSEINVLKDRYDLSATAIGSLGAYVMGAQTEPMQMALRESATIQSGRNTLEHPYDPENASEASWRKGVHELKRHWLHEGVNVTDLHTQGAYTASIYWVHERLLSKTAVVQPVVIPLIYKVEFPKFFGNADTVTLQDR